MAKWDNPIGIPFAENGDRVNIPDTSENGDVNNTTGFGNKYEIDPAVGGLWLYRQTMNSLFYNMFSSIKEIQTKVPISVNGSTPDVSGNISIPIPTADGAGIKIIDVNTDITSYNQITEDGIYYIYKVLSDGPTLEQYKFSGEFPPMTIVICYNVNIDNTNVTIQIFYTPGEVNYGVVPISVNSTSFFRNKENDGLYTEWNSLVNMNFANNSFYAEDFDTDKFSLNGFLISARNTTYDGNNIVEATREQMREQLGISDSNIEKWSTYTHSIYAVPGYSNNYKNISYCLFTKNINNIDYNMIKIQCLLSYSSESVTTYLNFRIPLPENINIYIDGTDLQNNVVAYIKCYCQNTSTEYDTAEKKVFLNGSMLGGIEKVGSDNYIIISASTASSVQANDPSIFLVEIEAFVDDTSYAPTPTAINVTKIMQDQITLTYTRGQ